MAGQFSIFISHVADDESIASCLKDFLEKIFLNADVFIASRDLKGGEIWVKPKARNCHSPGNYAVFSRGSVGALRSWRWFRGLTDHTCLWRRHHT